jgi:Lon protease-like protein
LFSQFSDVPVPGMEISLNIFEPRYQQMYQDVLSNGRRQVIVPFCHPYQSATFAQWGWLYEIVRVQDIADQTNGQVQLVCDHLVTKPVRIASIVNPSDWNTKITYLRAQAEIVHDDNFDPHDLQDIDALLRRLSSSSSSQENLDLVNRLLMTLGEGDLWSLVHVWVTELQRQVLHLQVEIAGSIQINANYKKVDNELIAQVQKPHRQEMESLLMELSTLVPLLLQESSPKDRCQRMYQRIQERLGNN